MKSLEQNEIFKATQNNVLSMIRSRMKKSASDKSIFSQLGASVAYEASDSGSSVSNNIIDAFSSHSAGSIAGSPKAVPTKPPHNLASVEEKSELDDVEVKSATEEE